MEKKNGTAVKDSRANKTVSLSKEMAGAAMIITVIATICAFIVGIGLGNQWHAGAMSGGLVVVLAIVLCAVACFIAYFFVRQNVKKIASQVTKISGDMTALGKGELTAQEQYQTKIKEINALEDSLRGLASRLNGYMADFQKALVRITQSDLDFEMNGEFAGSFALMQDTMNGILKFLNDIMHKIEGESAHVQDIAGQISSSSQNLAQGATEQAGAVEELLSTVNEISGKVGQTASATSNASEKAEIVRNEVTKSNQHMEHLTGAMNEINEYSKQVAKIVKIIEDIAFQTNILALNAAVEAARAGVNGRSFAVVADEVKNLATKSASAAADTTNLIRNTIAAVEKGMNISAETAGVLQGVVNSVDEVADIVSHISAATSQENVSIQQVVQGLDQVSVVVQSNSATAEEHAAVSHELSDFASNLQQLVGSFKLRKG